MDRTEKEELVASLHRLFDETALVVVTHYAGLSVAQMTELRARMGDAGAAFRVTKNRLTRRALEGTKFQPLSDMFVGPTAIAYSTDPVAAAKVTVNFARQNEDLVILGGAFNDQRLDEDGVKGLAALPSLDELRAGIVGLAAAPARAIAAVLAAPAGRVARVLVAYAERDQAA